MIRRAALRLALGAIPLATLPSCLLFQYPRGISVSSDPPGAAVLVDRRETGFVTPCVLALDARDDRRIDLILKGYEPETRFVTPDHEVYSMLWREMSVDYRSWDFPLFLDFRDFFVPVVIRSTCSPGRIHVHLDRSADVGSPGPTAALR